MTLGIGCFGVIIHAVVYKIPWQSFAEIEAGDYVGYFASGMFNIVLFLCVIGGLVVYLNC